MTGTAWGANETRVRDGEGARREGNGRENEGKPRKFAFRQAAPFYAGGATYAEQYEKTFHETSKRIIINELRETL